MGDSRNVLRLGKHYIDLERIKSIVYSTQASATREGPQRIIKDALLYMLGESIEDQDASTSIDGFNAHILHEFLAARIASGNATIARVTEGYLIVDYFMNCASYAMIDPGSVFVTWADGMIDEIEDHDEAIRKALEQRRSVMLEPDAKAREAWDRAMGKVQPASVHEDYGRYRARGGFLDPDAYKDLWTRYHRHLGAFGSNPGGDARQILDGYRSLLGLDPEPSGRLTADALKLGPDLSRMSEMPGLDRSVMHDITHPPDDDPPADAYPAGPAGWDQV